MLVPLHEHLAVAKKLIILPAENVIGLKRNLDGLAYDLLKSGFCNPQRFSGTNCLLPSMACKESIRFRAE